MTDNSRKNLINKFLTGNEWGNSEVNLLAGDASFRKYYRIRNAGKTAVLMDAPPPQENIIPFVNMAKYLLTNNLNAPVILAEDKVNGFLLLSDFGDDRFTRILLNNINIKNIPSEQELYQMAVDILVYLHKCPLPANISKYDDVLLTRELLLFTDWYLPVIYGKEKAADLRDEYTEIWQELLQHVHFTPEVTVLRDYHADNLMWLPENKDLQRVGLLDFQDAVIGSPAYDLVSLLEDARRDVDRNMATQMVEYYLEKSGWIKRRKEFLTSYSLLGAQRNLKIVGIFVRLAVRDAKRPYLQFLPRVWEHIEHDLKHPILGRLKNFLDKVVPEKNRKTVPQI